MDGYGNLIAGRLRKLAAAGSTGTLPFSGHCDGAIHFHDGQVVYAESTRTPGVGVDSLAGGPVGPVPSVGPVPPGPVPPGPVPSGPGPLSRLAAILAIAEPTMDAALELMSAESRYAKFRPARFPAVDPACHIPVDSLLAEVTRRQRLLRQLSAVVTADTAVARNPELNSPGVQISARQWALLIRVRPGVTPRALAWELRHSVFSTTAEVYRLLVLRLLSAAGHPARSAAADAAGEQGSLPGHGPALISFIRAVPTDLGVGGRPARTGRAGSGPVRNPALRSDPASDGPAARSQASTDPASNRPAATGPPADSRKAARMSADSTAGSAPGGER